jgi:predicted nucleic acid-binding protein
MNYLFDAFAWIAYLEGTNKGEKVNEILENENEIFTLPTTITEVISKLKRQDKNIETAYSAIIKNSKILNITPKIAKEAGLIHAEYKNKIEGISMADTLLISSAKATNSKIITGDNHFKSFKEAIIL